MPGGETRKTGSRCSGPRRLLHRAAAHRLGQAPGAGAHLELEVASAHAGEREHGAMIEAVAGLAQLEARDGAGQLRTAGPLSEGRVVGRGELTPAAIVEVPQPAGV